MSASPTDPSDQPSPASPPTRMPSEAPTGSGASTPSPGGMPRTIDAADLGHTLPPSEAAPCYLPFRPSSPDLPCRFGPYLLDTKIDAGGMGVVYRARQLFNPAEPSMSRVVALKMIRPEKLATPAVVKRFLSEAHSAARLEFHPNIVPIHDVGEIDGQPYFSMQYVPGGSLQHIIDEQYILPAQSIARLVKAIAEATHFAHTEAKIVHRDIKPSNILLAQDTRPESETDFGEVVSEQAVSFTRMVPKLTDFGLARNADSSLTVEGEVMGTPSYMPPEQARGDLSRIGPASDVYSLGAVLYALLTGQPPFDSPDAQATITRLLNDEPVPPRLTEKGKKTPPDLEKICLKCLEKDPDRRYPSAQALAEDLGRFLAGEPVQALPPQPLSLMLRKVRRRVRQWGGVAIVVACLAVIGFLLLRHKPQNLRDYEAAVEQVEGWAGGVAGSGSRMIDWDPGTERILDRLRQGPGQPELARRAGQACYRLASGLWERGYKDQAMRAANTTRAVCDDLEYNGNLNEQDRLLRARARMLLGQIEVDRHGFDRADEFYTAALADLCQLPPGHEDSDLTRAKVHHARGEMFNAQSRRARAIDEYEASIRLRQELVDRHPALGPGTREYWNDLARGNGYVGDTYLDRADLGRAEAAYKKAEEIRKRLHRTFGDNRTRQQLARSWMNTGRLRLRQGGPRAVDSAIERYGQAVDTFKDLVHNTGGRVAEFKEDLGWACLELSEALLDGDRLAAGPAPTQLAQQAGELFNELLGGDSKNLFLCRERARARLDIGFTLLSSNPEIAAEELDRADRELVELMEKPGAASDPNLLYLMAVLQSVRAEQDPRRETEHLVKAFTALGGAINKGFANAEQIERDIRLRRLRGVKKADLEELVRECRKQRAER
jgi:serine/threonine protein kinase/tetratricopeptide (TPR) repeat protein